MHTSCASRGVHAVMQPTIGYRPPGTIERAVLDDNGSNMESTLRAIWSASPSPTVPTHSAQASCQATLAVQPLRGGLVAVLSTLACRREMMNVLCSPVDLRQRAVCTKRPTMIPNTRV